MRIGCLETNLEGVGEGRVQNMKVHRFNKQMINSELLHNMIYVFDNALRTS